MSNSLVNFGIRGAQIIFAAIVTGLSIDLARGHHWGGLPVILGYVCFVGCVSLLAGFAGLASSWIEVLQGKIGLILDGFVTAANLAGGLLIAIKLKGVKCEANSSDYANGISIINNYLINGGIQGKGQDGVPRCYYCGYENNPDSDADILIGRCKKNQADSAFMFLTFVVLVASMTMTYLRMKKGY